MARPRPELIGATRWLVVVLFAGAACGEETAIYLDCTIDQIACDGSWIVHCDPERLVFDRVEQCPVATECRDGACVALAPLPGPSAPDVAGDVDDRETRDATVEPTSSDTLVAADMLVAETLVATDTLIADDTITPGVDAPEPDATDTTPVEPPDDTLVFDALQSRPTCARSAGTPTVHGRSWSRVRTSSGASTPRPAP